MSVVFGQSEQRLRVKIGPTFLFAVELRLKVCTQQNRVLFT